MAMMIRRKEARSGFDTTEVHIEHFGWTVHTEWVSLMFPSLSTFQFSLLQWVSLVHHCPIQSLTVCKTEVGEEVWERD